MNTPKTLSKTLTQLHAQCMHEHNMYELMETFDNYMGVHDDVSELLTTIDEHQMLWKIYNKTNREYMEQHHSDKIKPDGMSYTVWRYNVQNMNH